MYRIVSLTADRAIFFNDIQPGRPQMSVPTAFCELFGWRHNAPIFLRLERRGQAWTGPIEMFSGYEVTPRKDELLRKLMKPGSRVKVTVAPTREGLDAASWMDRSEVDEEAA